MKPSIFTPIFYMSVGVVALVAAYQHQDSVLTVLAALLFAVGDLYLQWIRYGGKK